MKKIKVVDVGPRDGFQSIKEFIPTELKIEIIERLISSNVKNIQLSSFVSPKAIPQLRDSKEVCRHFLDKYDDLNFLALVPNLYGAKNAYETGIRTATYVASVSESHNKANINRTVDQSFEELAKIRNDYPDLKISFDVATAFGCPFEGITPYQNVIDFVGRGWNLGVKIFNLCDTIGVATPDRVKTLVIKLKEAFPDAHFSIHIHDTRNMGMLNNLAAIENGIDEVQTSIGGLGGCPFAPGATGNTSTEDLVYMLNKMGYDTGIDFISLLDTAKFVRSKIEGNYSGHQINIAKEYCIY